MLCSPTEGELRVSKFSTFCRELKNGNARDEGAKKFVFERDQKYCSFAHILSLLLVILVEQARYNANLMRFERFPYLFAIINFSI